MTPTAGRVKLAQLRPEVSAAVDLARARGKLPSGPGEPSRMPGDLPLFVGSGAHAADLKLLKRLEISAVLNCAPSVCRDPVAAYKAQGIHYLALDAHDDRNFPLLKECMQVRCALNADARPSLLSRTRAVFAMRAAGERVHHGHALRGSWRAGALHGRRQSLCCPHHCSSAHAGSPLPL
jgi:hypothetical protein